MAVPAHAQRSYAIGISAGGAIPTGKFRKAHSKGQTVTGFIALGANELPIGLRFDGVFSTFKGRAVTPAGGGAAVQTPDLRLLGVVGNVILTASGTTAKPYLVGGAGFFNSKVDAPDARSRNDPGFSVGLGSTFNLGPLASLVEARYHSISRAPGDGGMIHFVPVTLGIMF